MGNRQYDSEDLSKEKRDWVAFYLGLQQVTEILMLFNIFYIFLFEGLIILPLVMLILIILKKWWMIMFDHRLLDQSSEQDFCLTMIGVTPAVITEQFVSFREIEFFIHHISIIIQIYYVVIHNNDKLNFLFTILLGVFADFSLFSQKKYFKYKKNLVILIQSAEIAIGAFLNITSIFLCFKNAFIGFLLVLFLIIETYCFTQKYGTNSIEEILVTQIGGAHQVKLRDNSVTRYYNNKEISFKRIFPFISFCQIVVINMIDFYFYDQEQLQTLRNLIYLCFLFSIPSFIYTLKWFVKFQKLGTHIKDILIQPQDMQNVTLQEAIKTFTSFQRYQIEINYFIHDCSYEFIQQIFDKILIDNKRIFQVEANIQYKVNKFQQKISNQKFEYQINFIDFSFFEIICQSIVETKLFVSRIKIAFVYQGQCEIEKNFILIYFKRFYQLSNCEIIYQDKNSTYYPFERQKLYQSFLYQISAFNSNIKQNLFNNSCQILYDLYEF